MTIDAKDLLNSILASIARIDYVKPEDIPNIDLYMDQVTKFMDEHLVASKRHDDDKVLTKTMINNYAKNNLLPPPVKKKYSKEHVLLLIFIYYFKNLISIKDIETLLDPITKKYFQNSSEDSLSLKDIYEEVFELENERIDATSKDIAKAYTQAMNTFPDLPENEAEYLQFFAFICSLSFDVYVKKMIIEKLIDQLPEPTHDKKKK